MTSLLLKTESNLVLFPTGKRNRTSSDIVEYRYDQPRTISILEQPSYSPKYEKSQSHYNTVNDEPPINVKNSITKDMNPSEQTPCFMLPAFAQATGKMYPATQILLGMKDKVNYVRPKDEKMMLSLIGNLLSIAGANKDVMIDDIAVVAKM